MTDIILLAYNLVSLTAVLLLSPVFLLIIALTPKYRLRIGERLGWNLRKKLSHLPVTTKNVIWIHALSVGETTSVLPLVKGLRRQYPQEIIILSSTTSSGGKLARTAAKPFVDAVIPAPLDLLPVIHFFINVIQPSLFILTETDFWPNWQLLLARRGIPTVLVNGRISAKSFNTYSSFSTFFRPFFSSFTAVSMQSQLDADNMEKLGVPFARIHTLGNLKLDTYMVSAKSQVAEKDSARADYGLSPDGPIWVAGSTHQGEEQIILTVFQQLRNIAPSLQLVIAPRDIDRGEELLALAHNCGFVAALRASVSRPPACDVYILNTIGELAGIYQAADVAFVGGSLVASGGHNPLEPAAMGIPVTFGPHMEDFTELASALVSARGAIQVDEGGIYGVMENLLLDESCRKQTGIAAQQWVKDNQGVVDRHLDILKPLLTQAA